MATANPPALLGLLDCAALSADGLHTFLPAFLGPEELRESSAIHHPRRREEWLAGRIAAKFVFLERESAGTVDPGSSLVLRHITSAALAKFPAEAYRDVAVARDQSAGGGPARIGRRFAQERIPVAISHRNGQACAFLGTSDVYSVDLEAPAPRIPEFYLHNFTAREQNWTGACARQFHLDPNWLYTLLWSAKECLLKTPRFRALSLWDMAALDIHILAGSERLKAIQEATTFSVDLQFLQAATTCHAGPARQFQMAVGGTANLILTAMTKLD
jgi:4'-phosphopantetheinyl transferase EntD